MLTKEMLETRTFVDRVSRYGRPYRQQHKTTKEKVEERIIRQECCWDSSFTKDPLGYARLSVWKNGKLTPMLLHRIVLALSGVDVPPNKCVMHTCDNPSCVNPDHLVLGTKHDNNSDMRIKKRSARGDVNGKAILSNSEAIAIKDALSGGAVGQRLAEKYNVSPATISSIKHGKRWIYLYELREERIVNDL
jgi:hypothetical protein